MANDFLPLGQSVGKDHLSFMFLSQGQFLETLMEKCLSYYRSIKTSGIKALHCGSLRCNGSNHGTGNETRSGVICECRPYHLLIISTIFYHLTSSAEVNVHLWELKEYQAQNEDFPAFIDPGWIKGHLAMTTVSIGQRKLWATVDLAKVFNLHI